MRADGDEVESTSRVCCIHATREQGQGSRQHLPPGGVFACDTQPYSTTFLPFAASTMEVASK
jgi:hypothetical protein